MTPDSVIQNQIRMQGISIAEPSSDINPSYFYGDIPVQVDDDYSDNIIALASRVRYYEKMLDLKTPHERYHLKELCKLNAKRKK